MSKIIEFCTNDNAEKVAESLVSHFASKATMENIDYQFDSIQGQVNDDGLPNTFFNFDPDDDSILDQMKTIFFDEEADDDQEALNVMQNFLSEVGNIMVESHCDTIRDTIRRCVIPDTIPDLFPLNKIKVLLVDVLDLSSMHEESKHQLLIHKIPTTDQVYIKSVVQDLYDTKIETGMDYNDIIALRKKQNDPNYTYIEGVESKKILFEYGLSMFVDYSPVPEEESKIILAGKK